MLITCILLFFTKFQGLIEKVTFKIFNILQNVAISGF